VQEAPALLLGQALDLQLEEVDVVGAGGKARHQLGALRDVQADLHPWIACAEGSDKPGGHGARLGLGGKAQRLGGAARAAEGGEQVLGAGEQRAQLLAYLVQSTPGRGDLQVAALLLEQRELERFRELPDLLGYGRLGEVQLGGGARDAAQAGDGFEDEELRQQPMAEESTQLGA